MDEEVTAPYTYNFIIYYITILLYYIIIITYNFNFPV